jgi:mitochondrial cardiolipin hydrolase
VDEIKKRHNAGVRVRVISDDHMLKMKGSDIKELIEAGIACRTDSSPYFHMHHKFAIIDKKILLTGSFNWTK